MKTLSKIFSWKYWGILFFLIPIIAYICKFYDNPISDNPSDWADFGSYIGGIYTVLVTIYAIYLTRYLEKKDVAWNKTKNAVEEIYIQISKIDYHKISLKSVSKMLNLVNKNQLYIPSYLYHKLIDLHDDYLDASGDIDRFDVQKESAIKNELKKLYES